jgi:hypothetical protein
MNSVIFASPLRVAVGITLTVVAFFSFVTVHAAPPSRTWTDSTGKFKRQGRLLELDGDTVVLETSEGKTLRIPLEKLSKQDREFVEAAGSTSADPFEADASRTASPREGSDAPRPRSTAPGDGQGDIRTIVVEGVGTDATQAKADAYREAVRQVVGALIDARTMAQNDELVEDKIITLSSAFVEKSEPLKEWQDGSLVRVRILAHVRQSKVLASLTTPTHHDHPHRCGVACGTAGDESRSNCRADGDFQGDHSATAHEVDHGRRRQEAGRGRGLVAGNGTQVQRHRQARA